MLKIKNVEFIKSTLDWRDAPGRRLPEVAFVGRSNVGKSSLINCLVNINNFARVSKQPGKTRTINYFLVDEKFYLVDLPGYGFAKISLAEKDKWQKSIEAYLLNGERLVRLFVLIDAKVGPKSSDLQLVEWLSFNHIPYTLVATKIDRIPPSKQKAQLKAIRSEFALQPQEDLIAFSAKKRTGKGELTGFIGKLLAEAKK